jgi:23S rRNA (cytosine1962-C5)-methyltransferase
VARARFPFVRAAVWKARHAADPAMRTGTLLFGEARDVDRSVRENGVRYAILPTVNHDASFYVDTRALRAWAKDALKDKRVLNAFAYTGSLGVAACAGGAKQVVHLDKSRAFLSVAKDSYTLNGFPIRRSDFVAADFFEQVARYKRADELFDCVFVDPPFFAAGGRGRIDLEAGAARVFNKVRPLVGDGGALVAVNNALFVSGKEYLGVLEAMCKDGYLTIESLVPVPDDARGMVPRGTPAWPSDPAPFGHPTKIAVLRVRRKDGRRA